MEQEALINIVSTIAGICMAICQIPQAMLIWKTGKTDGISLTMQAILTTGITCWMIVGFLYNSVPMYVSNGFCALSCYYILAKCIQNKVKKGEK